MFAVHQPESTRSGLIDYACSLCGSKSRKVIYESTIKGFDRLSAEDFNCTNAGHGEHFRIVQCADCSMMYCSPRPSVEALIEAYGNVQDETYAHHEPGRQRTFARSFRHIQGRGGKLLDVGCMTGVFLEQAKKRGFECFGIEPSSYAAKIAREQKGFDVIAAAVPCQIPWQHKFDVVTMWDVIEHVDDPLSILKFLRELLKEGGQLHMSTMDIGSFYARLAGPKWPWLMRMHIQYFSKDTMREMLRRAGFSKVEIFAYSHIVHRSYLEAKLKALALPLRIIGQLGGRILSDKDGFVRVNMGDMMHVRAVR